MMGTASMVSIMLTGGRLLTLWPFSLLLLLLKTLSVTRWRLSFGHPANFTKPLIHHSTSNLFSMKKCRSLRKFRGELCCMSTHVCYKLLCLDPEGDLFARPVAHIGPSVSEYSSLDEVNRAFDKHLHNL